MSFYIRHLAQAACLQSYSTTPDDFIQHHIFTWLTLMNVSNALNRNETIQDVHYTRIMTTRKCQTFVAATLACRRNTRNGADIPRGQTHAHNHFGKMCVCSYRYRYSWAMQTNATAHQHLGHAPNNVMISE